MQARFSTTPTTATTLSLIAGLQQLHCQRQITLLYYTITLFISVLHQNPYYLLLMQEISTCKCMEEECSQTHFDVLTDDSQYVSTDGHNLWSLAVLQLEVGVQQSHDRPVVVTRALLQHLEQKDDDHMTVTRHGNYSISPVLPLYNFALQLLVVYTSQRDTHVYTCEPYKVHTYTIYVYHTPYTPQ